MKLLIQPEDGVAPLVAAIKKAKKSVDIVIFRFDRAEIEAALKDAAERGVSVSALIAYANHGGEKSLRKLEMRLLEAGVTVSRTADDLSRYHDKLLIIDRRVLYVLSFNFTHLDIDHSRGFGIVTKKGKLVQEALKLLEADNDRTRYDAGLDTFVVSPVNARKQLLALIRRAKKELLIYDPKIADPEMLSALSERAKKGVDVRVIGSVGRKSPHLKVRPLSGFRLHTRTIVRDRREVFVGSQSLRKAELDSRREVGVIVRDSKVVSGVVNTFEADWAAKETAETIAGHATGAQEEAEGDGRQAVAAESPGQGSGAGGDLERGQHRAEQDRGEGDRREGGEGSRPGASAGNVERDDRAVSGSSAVRTSSARHAMKRDVQSSTAKPPPGTYYRRDGFPRASTPASMLWPGVKHDRSSTTRWSIMIRLSLWPVTRQLRMALASAAAILCIPTAAFAAPLWLSDLGSDPATRIRVVDASDNVSFAGITSLRELLDDDGPGMDSRAARHGDLLADLIDDLRDSATTALERSGHPLSGDRGRGWARGQFDRSDRPRVRNGANDKWGGGTSVPTTAVPEPTTLTLLGVGLITAATWARRRVGAGRSQ